MVTRHPEARYLDLFTVASECSVAYGREVESLFQNFSHLPSSPEHFSFGHEIDASTWSMGIAYYFRQQLDDQSIHYIADHVPPGLAGRALGIALEYSRGTNRSLWFTPALIDLTEKYYELPERGEAFASALDTVVLSTRYTSDPVYEQLRQNTHWYITQIRHYYDRLAAFDEGSSITHP